MKWICRMVEAANGVQTCGRQRSSHGVQHMAFKGTKPVVRQ
jgi:hypothetical protein